MGCQSQLCAVCGMQCSLLWQIAGETPLGAACSSGPLLWLCTPCQSISSGCALILQVSDVTNIRNDLFVDHFGQLHILEANFFDFEGRNLAFNWFHRCVP